MTTPERTLFERIKAFMVRGKFGAAKAICADVDKKLIDAERRNEPLQIIANSVAAALEQAGFDYVDDPGEAISIIADERDQLRARCGELEKACRYTLDDDGLIPRATSKCREVVRAALNEQTKAPQPAQEQKL